MEIESVINSIVKTIELHHVILESNEAQTRWMLIDTFLLDGLGYSREDIVVEYSMDLENKYNYLDYSVFINDKPRLLVEAKSLGVNLFEKQGQLAGYFNYILQQYPFKMKELLGILTDGDTYLFFTNSRNNMSMDTLPFFKVKLSVAEDFEISQLKEFTKKKQTNRLLKDVCVYDTMEYELQVPYRIDTIDDVFQYFNLKGTKVKIENVYLKGKKIKVNSFKDLYRKLLKEINALYPDLLYNLAKNNKIQSGKNYFALQSISYSEIIVNTKNGPIFVSYPNSRKNIIERIIYILKESNYGLNNVLISLI